MSLILIKKYGEFDSKKDEAVKSQIKADERDSLINVDRYTTAEKAKTVGDTYKTGHCPEGHGFVVKIKKKTDFPHWSLD